MMDAADVLAALVPSWSTAEALASYLAYVAASVLPRSCRRSRPPNSSRLHYRCNGALSLPNAKRFSSSVVCLSTQPTLTSARVCRSALTPAALGALSTLRLHGLDDSHGELLFNLSTSSYTPAFSFLVPANRIPEIYTSQTALWRLKNVLTNLLPP
ncbi:hypothetical protein ZWY2020_030629 [Hordeum vulgare]|nr:hypothetical protein ZWY2020_030629 [Hordeum vulgare]